MVGRMERYKEQVAIWWRAERSRRFLWLPVCFGAGIGLYLGLPVEPPLYLMCILSVLTAVAALFLWARASVLVVAMLLVTSGAGWTCFLTHMNTQTVLHEALEPRPVMGVVNDIVRTENGVRFTLDKVVIDRLPPEDTPQRIRLSVRLKKGTDPELPHIGDLVGMRAGVRPPMGPVLPHGFDFARYFYFRDIGGVGYGLPPWKVIAPEGSQGLYARFMTWRLGVTEDILHTLGTGTGGIAAGLITGDARAITKANFEDLRASNLYHIIAISGEHMVVIAGVIFVTLRMLSLVLLPKRIALRPQTKTMAAIITLALITVYLFVTGLPISAIRAYVMIFLVLLAVILRRQVDPMRSLSITAFLMLLVDPSNLLDPGFQLSFAATLAIIALVESAVMKPREGMEDGRYRRGLRLFLTMVLISVVAEAATTPLVIAQFNTMSLYGVLANMLATPVMSLFLMPTVALYFILLPLGLEHVALWLMKYGIQVLMGIAEWVAGLPHAQFFAPSLPGYGVALFVLGLLWVCLWRTRARRLGFIAIVLGVATIGIGRSPDMLVGGELKQVVLRTADGYVLAKGRATSMIPTLWANGLGYKELPEADAPAWRCDNQGCVARVKDHTVALPVNAAALAEDCQHASVVLTTFSGAACAGDVLVLDKAKLANSNVVALWFDGAKVRTQISADWQGARPWSAREADVEE